MKKMTLIKVPVGRGVYSPSLSKLVRKI